MNNINLDVEDYTDNELLDIAEISQEASSEIIDDKFTLLIKQNLNDKNYKLAQFFHDAKEKILDNLTKKEENDNIDNNNQSEDWLMNQYRDPVNEIQKSKITDRRHTTNIFDGNARQVMSQKQLGINNNYPVNFIQDTLNPTLKQVVKRYISINSSQRYNSIPFINSLSSKNSSSNFTINLNNPINNVVSMKIESFNIPNTIYTFDPLYGNNVMMILTTRKDVDDPNFDWNDFANDISCCTRVNMTPGSYKNPIDFVNQLNIDIRRCQSNSQYPLLGPGISLDGSAWDPEDPCASADISGCFMSLQAHLADPLSISPRIVFVNTNVTYNVKIVFYKRVGLGDTFTPFDNYSDCSACSPSPEYKCSVNSNYTNNLGYIAGYRIERRINSEGEIIFLNTNKFGSELSIVLKKINGSKTAAYTILSKINQLLPTLDGTIAPLFSQSASISLPIWFPKNSVTGNELFPTDLNPLLIKSYTMQQYSIDINNLLNLYKDNNVNSDCNYYSIASVPINLVSSEYIFVCINDFNKNKSSDGIITVAPQEDEIWPIASNRTNSWSNKKNLEDQILDLSADLVCYKDIETNDNKEFFVPTWPRTLTQSQIYSLNQINSNNKRQKEDIYNTTSIEDVLASIPFQNNKDISVKDSNLRIRHYFGPVKIDRLEITLKNSKGNLVNLNGQDWAFNIELEQLYQY